MCGIGGVLEERGPDRAVLARMCRALAHRGPDGEGIFSAGPVGLVHRRLAIIDLSEGGAQPMRSRDGRYVLSYNGELYNFRELKTELEALGYAFASKSDTEVMLYAFAAWGERALERFNGMFALALWDMKTQELLLARDRYGVKPLYYAAPPGAFVFGSEIKAILAHPSVRTALDREGLYEYFSFQNFLTDRTLFAGVRLLPAGSSLRVRAGEAPGTPRLYWDFHFAEPASPGDDEEYIDELDRRFGEAVKRQLVSDVDVGAYLSGGMDSGSITAVAASTLPYMRTFTAGFDLSSASGIELGFDERAKAEQMSYLFRTEHYEAVLKAGDMERVLPALVRHLEEPRVGQSYPNYYAAQLASKFVKVVLSGAGGDEIFGGYPWRYYRAVVNDDFDHYIDKYYAFWQRLIPDDAMAAVFRPLAADVRHVDTRAIFRGVFSEHAAELSRPEDYVNHSLYFEAKTFLHGLLIVEDKLSMAHGLETRVPFLDNDLVDFALQMPVHLKLGNLREVVRMNENEPGFKTERYYQRTRDGKLALRRALERHIPRSVTEAVKQGFSAPDASWFKGDSIEFVRRRILSPKARIYSYLDFDAVSRLVLDHLEGRQNRRLLIWSLLTFEQWCEAFL